MTVVYKFPEFVYCPNVLFSPFSQSISAQTDVRRRSTVCILLRSLSLGGAGTIFPPTTSPFREMAVPATFSVARARSFSFRFRRPMTSGRKRKMKISPNLFFAFIFQTKFKFESFLQLPTTAVSTHQTLKLSITKLPELYKMPQNFLLGENYLFNFSLTKIKCDQIGLFV